MKRTLVSFSLFVGAAVNVVRAVAPNMMVIVISSTLWGLVSAGIYVIGFSMIRDMYDQKKAGLFLGAIGTVLSIGMLAGLTKSIAVEYAEQGIRCNIINPGGTQTDIGSHSGGNYHPAMASLSKIVAALPIKCYLDPVEIARACLFLCGDESKCINGVVLAVDRGMACC
jgi:NAD(P)-dependent dehydrogenase (short-subunit alcohol dehydrogenase family)